MSGFNLLKFMQRQSSLAITSSFIQKRSQHSEESNNSGNPIPNQVMIPNSKKDSLWDRIERWFKERLESDSRLESFRQKLGQLTEEKTENCKQTLQRIALSQMDQFQKALEPVTEATLGDFRKDLEREAQATLATQKSPITQAIQEVTRSESKEFSSMLEAMTTSKRKKFTEALATASAKEQASFASKVKADSEVAEAEVITHLEATFNKTTLDFSRDVDIIQKHTQQLFQQAVQQIRQSNEAGFSALLQQYMHAQHLAFMTQVNTSGQSKIQDFKAELQSVATQIATQNAADFMRSMQQANATQLSATVRDIEQQVQENVRQFTQGEIERIAGQSQQITHLTEEGIRELDQKQIDYAQAISQEERRIETLTQTLADSVKKEALRGPLKKVFFSIASFAAVNLLLYLQDRYEGHILNKKVLEAFDLLLELNSPDAVFAAHAAISAIRKDFENKCAETFFSTLDVNRHNRFILWLSSYSQAEVQVNLWASQLLLLHADPELADFLLDKNKARNCIYYMTKGWIFSEVLNYHQKARDSYEAALRLSEKDEAIQARIYIGLSRLKQKKDDVSEAIKDLDRAILLLANSKQLKIIALRDKGMLMLSQSFLTPAEREILSGLLEEIMSQTKPTDLLYKQAEISLQILEHKKILGTPHFPKEKEKVDENISQASKAMVAKYRGDLSVYDLVKKLIYEAKLPPLQLAPSGFGITSDYEYALMSARSYGALGTDLHSSLYGKALSEQGWEIITSQSLAVETAPSGFNAYAFYHARRKEIVIAFRGSANVDNLRTDAMLWLDDNTKRTPLFTEAERFISIAKNELRKRGSNVQRTSLALTGHSLGAWLAEYTLWELIAKRTDNPLEEKWGDIHAVTFDSPGTGQLIESRRKNIPWSERVENPLPLVSYVAAPNAINTAKPHLGMLIQLPIDYVQPKVLSWMDWIAAQRSGKKLANEWVGLLKQAIQTINTHGVECFIKQFDPTTGHLKSDDLAHPRLVKSWPVGLEAHGNYLRMAEKAKARGARDFDGMQLSIADEHTLKHQASYETRRLDLFQIKRSKIQSHIWHYLSEYMRTNGDSDAGADRTVMRYRIQGDTIYSLSEFTARDLVHYAENRLRGNGIVPFVSFFTNMRRQLRLEQTTANISYEEQSRMAPG